MKTQSDCRPEPIESIGRGNYYVNMDVREVREQDQEAGVERVHYEYECVRSTGYPTYGGTVEALIRERYTESDELALHRQRDTKPVAFAEYDDYCEWCKSIARPVFYPEQQNGGE